jgi:hypothetical protein
MMSRQYRSVLLRASDIHLLTFMLTLKTPLWSIQTRPRKMNDVRTSRRKRQSSQAKLSKIDCARDVYWLFPASALAEKQIQIGNVSIVYVVRWVNQADARASCRERGGEVSW